MPNAVGLFLGAGASYELGMPLVTGLTTELREVLTPEHVRSLAAKAKGTQAEIAEDVVEDFLRVLAIAPMHYEAVLGYLQVESRRNQERRQHYGALAEWLLETVYFRLYRRHILFTPHVLDGLRFLDGIVGLAKTNAPLWVFSLNHDCIIECLAAAFEMPLSCGLVQRSALPLRGVSGEIVGEIPVEMMSGDDLNTTGLQFLPPGTTGINLLKIHGGLEMFMANEGHDIVRVLPSVPGAQGVVDSLRLTNTQLLLESGVKSPTTNMIVLDDAAGTSWFLRRSLLAGAYKFDGRNDQVVPEKYLDVFESGLLWVSHLVCIGYGFGDLHINAKIRSWLELFNFRRLTIVSPDRLSVPSPLLHLTQQIDIVKTTATEYLRQFSPQAWTMSDELAKVVHDGVRQWLRARREAL